MGEICSGCHIELSKAKFSNKQWTCKDDEKRRCKQCTSNNISSRPLPEHLVDEQTAGNSNNNKPIFQLRKPIDYIDEDHAREKLKNFPDDISCWICLEEKDMPERPLLRDCCCRGDYSGWAHYECLSKYATQQIDSEIDGSKSGSVELNPGGWNSKWTGCPNCNQSYENDLNLAMSAGFVRYIEEKEGLMNLRGFILTESYMALLTGFKSAVHIEDSYFKELEQAANKILKELLPKLKKEKDSIVPQQRLLELEADLHRTTLSYIAEDKGDYGAAIEYEKHALSLFQLLSSGAIELMYELSDYEAKIAIIEEDIDKFQKFLENGDGEQAEEDKEKLDMVELKKSRRLYELSKREAGEFSVQAVNRGIHYARVLNLHSNVKSSKLIKKLYAESKRIFGPEHSVTEKAKEKMEEITHLGCSVLSLSHGMMEFDVLAYDAKEDCYLLRVPDSDSINEEEGSENDRYKDMRNKTIYSPRRRCILSQTVPVAVAGLPQGPLEHLNGKMGETKMFSFSTVEGETDDPNMLRCYTIQFEDDNIDDCDVPPGNVFMLAPQLEQGDRDSLKRT